MRPPETFAPESPTSSPQRVVTADFDGDGKLDLAVADRGDNVVRLYLGRGDGTFREGREFAAGIGPTDLVAADVDGKVLPPDDFEAQAKMVMANLTKALAAGGAKISDVTKITIYICNPHDVPKARGLLQTYFAGNPPGSTLCILRGLANPNFLLEIEAIAAV